MPTICDSGSSLDCSIWHSFCLFLVSDHLKLSSDVIFWTTITSYEKAIYGQSTLDCRNTSKKNPRYYSRDYSGQWWSFFNPKTCSNIQGWAAYLLMLTVNIDRLYNSTCRSQQAALFQPVDGQSWLSSLVLSALSALSALSTPKIAAIFITPNFASYVRKVKIVGQGISSFPDKYKHAQDFVAWFENLFSWSLIFMQTLESWCIPVVLRGVLMLIAIDKTRSYNQ